MLSQKKYNKLGKTIEMIRFGTVLTFLTAIFFPLIAAAGNSSSYWNNRLPIIKGDYFVCPNGGTLPRDYFGMIVDKGTDFNPKKITLRQGNSLSNFQVQFNKLSRLDGISSEIIVKKQGMIKSFMEKMLYQKFLWSDWGKEVRNPNSYRAMTSSTSPSIEPVIVGGEHSNNPKKISRWKYSFKNSEGKTLILNKNYPEQITTNRGNTFNLDWNFQTKPIAFMYCSPRSISLRIVFKKNIDGVKNKYGQSLDREIPTIFLMINTAYKLGLPQSQTTYPDL